jgi:hypothetical protein
MSTNKVALKTVEQFMSDYQPVYQPLYPLFLGKSQQYSEEVGKLNFKRAATVGDIRAHHITPKDTEIRQISVQEGSKTFKKYFLANQFQLSHLQSQEGVSQTVAEVLDEHQRHQDDLFLLGEGTSDSTMLNNGLFWSDDPNYTLENSGEIDSTDRMYDFHSDVMVTVNKSKLLSGRKAIIFYGTSVLPLYNGLYPSVAKPWKSVLAEVLGPNFIQVEMPADCTPSGTNGWIVANLDQVKLHYTTLPKLDDQGSNDEKKYFWFNFIMGSMMLECLAPNAVIRQPATLE